MSRRNSILEGLCESRANRTVRDLVLLRANYNKDLHDAIIKGDQKFLDNYIKNYPDTEELSWYKMVPVKIDTKLKNDLREQDALGMD